MQSDPAFDSAFDDSASKLPPSSSTIELFPNSSFDYSTALSKLPTSHLLRHAPTNSKLCTLASFLFALAHGAVPIALLLLIKRVLSFLQEEQDSNDSLSSVTATILGLSVASAVLAAAQLFLARSASRSLGVHLRSRLFAALLSVPHDSTATLSDARAQATCIQAGASATQHFVTALGAIIVALLLSWRVTLLAISPAPLLALLLPHPHPRSHPRASTSAAAAIAAEVLGLAPVVAAFSAQRSEADRYDVALRAASRSAVASSLQYAIRYAVSAFLALAAPALALWYAGTSTSTFAQAAVAVIAVVVAARCVASFATALGALDAAREAAGRVHAAIEMPVDIDPLDTTCGEVIPRSQLQGQVSFDGVSFTSASTSGYSSLRAFSMQVKSGTSVMLIGDAGCVPHLLSRSSDTTVGTIRLDGRDVRSLNTRWLRGALGIVPRNAALFTASVRDNISIGEDVPLHDVVAAAKMAGAHDFIMKLPYGYDTSVARGGLTDAQTARLCLARALVRDPPVLAVHAGEEAEPEFLETVRKAGQGQGRTVIVVTERPADAAAAGFDAVCVVHNGGVAEYGTPEQLGADGSSMYAAMVRGLSKSTTDKKSDGKMEDDMEYDEDESSAGTMRTLAERAKSTLASLDHDQFDTVKETSTADSYMSCLARALRLGAPDWPLLFIGCCAAAAVGVVFPLSVRPMVDLLLDDGRAALFRALRFGAALFAGVLLQVSCLGAASARLQCRAQGFAFRSLLFSRHPRTEESTEEELQDVALVSGLTSGSAGVLFNVSGALVTAAAFSCAACWRVALPVLALTAVAAFSQSINSGKKQGTDEQGDDVAMDALSNIDSVRAGGAEPQFALRVQELAAQAARAQLPRDVRSSILSAFGAAASGLAVYSASLLATSTSTTNCTLLNTLVAVSTPFLVYAVLPSFTSAFPDIHSARRAARSLFARLDSATPPRDAANDVLARSRARGDVIARSLRVHASSGELIAMVGDVGVTTKLFNSLLRLEGGLGEGAVELDRVDLRLAAPAAARAHIGYVPRTGGLFGSRSVFDNVAYGLRPGEPATTEVVREALRKAGAKEDMLQTMEARVEGLDNEGMGSVALARALVRDPSVLLVHEGCGDGATGLAKGARDAVVNAAGRRTVLVAAEVADSQVVKAADCVFVMRDGKAVAEGSYEELVARDGPYAQLLADRV